jgi:hypothetical protein
MGVWRHQNPHREGRWEIEIKMETKMKTKMEIRIERRKK